MQVQIKKRKISYIKPAIASLLCLVIFSSFGDPSGGRQKPALRTIIIDAGHGGKDPGARGLVTTESAVALDIALKLGKAIQQEFPEIKVVYTRTSDILPGNGNDVHQALRVRADMANEAKGDLFISIHCNSNGHPAGGWYAKRVIGHKKKLMYVGRGKRKRKKWVNTPIYESYWVKNNTAGTETYVWAADRSGSKSEHINQTDEMSGENEEDSLNVVDLSSPEAKIRGQLYEKLYFGKSALIGSFVEDEFKKAGRTSSGVKQRNYKGIWVLQATGMPSILIETGFITNKEEEEYLDSDNGQDEIVSNIMEGLKRYKTQIESSRPVTK